MQEFISNSDTVQTLAADYLYKKSNFLRTEELNRPDGVAYVNPAGMLTLPNGAQLFLDTDVLVISGSLSLDVGTQPFTVPAGVNILQVTTYAKGHRASVGGKDAAKYHAQCTVHCGGTIWAISSDTMGAASSMTRYVQVTPLKTYQLSVIHIAEHENCIKYGVIYWSEAINKFPPGLVQL